VTTPPRPNRHGRRAVVAIAAVLLVAMLALPAGSPVFASGDASDTCAAATPLPLGAWHTENLSSALDVDWFTFSTSSSQRALLSLGGLNADDRLDLYGACGTLLATSNRPGTQFEEIYRALPVGTYHLRVESAAGPFSTVDYGLRVRLLPSTVLVLSSSGWLEYPNEPRIAGEVLNNTSVAREDIRIRVRFYDSLGHLIRTRHTWARFERLPAWSRSMFVWDDEIVPGYASYRVQVVSAPVAGATPFTGLTVTPGGSSLDSGGGRTFHGQLKNPTGHSIGVPRVMVTIYDAYGRVSNAGFVDTTPDPMHPHSINPYDLYLSDRSTGNRTVFSSHGYPQ
jgi:hypothetical protein